MIIEFTDFLNVFDIFSLVIIIFSALFSLKGGLMTSLLNLIKWILLVLVLKYSFNYLRVPFKDALDLSPTLTDILIFTSVLIIGYVVFTILNRLILGLINTDKTGPINRLFGLVFGIIRGYILIVIIFSVLINWSFSENILNSYNGNSVLFEIVESGNKILRIIPQQIQDRIESI
ncbi:CvpA family protein [Pelagibacteraceae bacterium]|nr:CvpA family protein [Pelagibacteraceae bacterium]